MSPQVELASPARSVRQDRLIDIVKKPLECLSFSRIGVERWLPFLIAPVVFHRRPNFFTLVQSSS
jgi:hypothetical protein